MSLHDIDKRQDKVGDTDIILFNLKFIFGSDLKWVSIWYLKKHWSFETLRVHEIIACWFSSISNCVAILIIQKQYFLMKPKKDRMIVHILNLKKDVKLLWSYVKEKTAISLWFWPKIIEFAKTNPT